MHGLLPELLWSGPQGEVDAREQVIRVSQLQ